MNPFPDAGSGIALPFALSFLAPSVRFEDPPNPTPTPDFDVDKYIEDILKKIPAGLEAHLQGAADKNDAGWKALALTLGEEVKTLRGKFRDLAGAEKGAMVITDADDKDAINTLRSLMKDGETPGTLKAAVDSLKTGRDAANKLGEIERARSVADTLGDTYNVEAMRQMPGFEGVEFSKIEVDDPNNDGQKIVQRNATYTDANGAKVTKPVDDLIADRWPAFETVLIKSADDGADTTAPTQQQRTVPVQGGGGGKPAPPQKGQATGEAASAVNALSADAATFFPGGLGDKN